MNTNFRVSPQKTMNFTELVVDNFAGGGGASTGIEDAIGRPVDIAINHDPQAIGMHKTNHPGAQHYEESVWAVDPRAVTNSQPVGLAWFSPDCRHHSKASGKRPVSTRVRGLAWVTLKWAGLTKPRVIILENVEEFEDWGPITRSGRPCKRNKGVVFERFVAQLRALGYRVDWRTIRACDYGAPTIRKRLFLVARRDNLPIVWPTPTHGVGAGLKPYRTAREIIDWSIPCPSIFTRKRPLVEKTMARIAKGLERFIFNGHPKIIELQGQNEFANEETSGLVVAFLAKHFGGVTGVTIDVPLPTITTRGTQTQIVTSHLIKLRGTCKDGQSIDKPLPTLTAGGNHVGEIRTYLSKYKGANHAPPINVGALDKNDRAKLGILEIDGVMYQIIDIGMRMLSPRELYRAQGFPEDYVINVDSMGQPIKITQQIHKCGNSVSPVVAKALVRANYVDCELPIHVSA